MHNTEIQGLTPCSVGLDPTNPVVQREVGNEVLENNRDWLCRNLEPSRHIPFLRSKRVFNLTIQEEIEAIPTTKGRVSKFIDELMRNGGSNTFGIFIEALKAERTKLEVVQRLNKEFENLIYNPPLTLKNRIKELSGPVKTSPPPTVEQREPQESSYHSSGYNSLRSCDIDPHLISKHDQLKTHVTDIPEHYRSDRDDPKTLHSSYYSSNSTMQASYVMKQPRLNVKGIPDTGNSS